MNSSIRKNGNNYKLIWENENPNQAFVGQTITFDKSYKGVIIIGKPHKNSDITIYYIDGIAMLKSNSNSLFGSVSDDGNMPVYRKIWLYNDGQSLDISNVVQNSNDYVIPLRIYAITKEL